MSALAYRAADQLARALPGGACDAIAMAVADAAWALHVPARDALEQNLALAPGGPDPTARPGLWAALEPLHEGVL